MLGELARREENAGGTVPQHIVVLHLQTLQLRHGHRVHLRRCNLATSQQLPSIGAFRIGAAKVLPKAPGFELHVGTAFIAFNERTVVTFNAELSLLDLIAVAIWIVATDMQLAGLIDQVAVHRGVAFSAASLGEQQPRLGLVVSIDADRLITRNQIHGALTALLGRQAVTRAPHKDPRAGGADLHRSTASVAGNACRRGIVGLHAIWPVVGRLRQLAAEVCIKLVEQIGPRQCALGHFIESLLHGRGEPVVQ